MGAPGATGTSDPGSAGLREGGSALPPVSAAVRASLLGYPAARSA